jgi:hypothetical protein
MLVATLAIAAALAGCGGDGGDSDSGPTGGAEANATTGGSEGPGANSEPGPRREGKGGGANGKNKGGGKAPQPEAPSGAEGGVENGRTKDGASGSPTPGSSTSKAQFVKQANAICAAGREKTLAKLGTYVKTHQGSAKSQQALLGEALQAVFLPRIQSQIGQLRALEAPTGDQRQVNALLAALQQAVNRGHGLKSPSSAEIEQDFKRPAELAKAYGIGACAYG